jgi:hypothetical protein
VEQVRAGVDCTIIITSGVLVIKEIHADGSVHKEDDDKEP